jgi:hypothetical protein
VAVSIIGGRNQSTSRLQTLSHKVVSSTPRHERYYGQMGHDFFMEFVMFVLFAIQLDYRNIQRVHDQR